MKEKQPNLRKKQAKNRFQNGKNAIKNTLKFFFLSAKPKNAPFFLLQSSNFFFVLLKNKGAVLKPHLYF